ncbi:hypothetical protein D9611_010409 [Ephemerocybe angulata]|uniref:CCHC-type domain-containing protein n=1 Tax=Ephemerocybe angulata TaxID=980116 RepID=A0A8H5BV35_9AGAR|nr:hypothetical protein D9611_010409 [Tulosesus angulatus]
MAAPALVYERSRTLPARSGTTPSASRAPAPEEPVELAEHGSPSTKVKAKSPAPAALAPSYTAAPQVTYASPDPAKTVFSVTASPQSSQISAAPPPLTPPDQSTPSASPKFLTPPASPRIDKRPASSDSESENNERKESEYEQETDEEQVTRNLLDETASESTESAKSLASDKTSNKMATKTIADMPWPKMKGAPSYGGDPRDLVDFFAQFEAIAAANNVDDGDKPELVLRYVEEREDRENWKGLDGYEIVAPATTRRWTVWKKAVLDSYAEEEKETLRTFDDLASFIRTEAGFKINTMSDFARYHRRFGALAKPLIKDETLTTKQENLFFWQGLHPETQKRLMARIDVVDTTRKPQDVPDIKTTSAAAEYVLSPRAWTAGIGGAGARYASDEDLLFGRGRGVAVDEVDQRRALERIVEKAVRERSGKERRDVYRDEPEVTTKRVAFEERVPAAAPQAKSKLDEVEDLVRQMSGMKVGDGNYAGFYYRLQTIDPSIVETIPTPVFEYQNQQTQRFESPSNSHVYAVMPQGYLPRSPQDVINRAPAQSGAQRWAGGGFAAQNRGQWNAPPRAFSNPLVGRCFFCGGDGHMAGFCAVGNQYVQEGRCVRDASTGRYYHADGSTIWAQGGLTWKDAVDAKIGSGSGQQNAGAQASTSKSPMGTGGYLPTTYSFRFAQNRLLSCYSRDQGNEAKWWSKDESGVSVAEVVEREEEGDTVSVEGATKAVEVAGGDVEGVEENQRRVWFEEMVHEVQEEEVEEDVWMECEEEESKREDECDEDGDMWEDAREEVEEDEEKEGRVYATTRSGKDTGGSKRGQEEDVTGGGRRRVPAYKNVSRAADVEAPTKFYKRILDAVIPDVTVGDLWGLSGDVRKFVVEKLKMVRVPREVSGRVQLKHRVAAVRAKAVPGVDLGYTELLREMDVRVNGGKRWIVATVDSGSELVVVSRKMVEKCGLIPNEKIELSMEAANGAVEKMGGCVEWLEIEVEGMKTWVHAFVVEDAPYDLLLGLPWQKCVRMETVIREDGEIDLVIHNPLNYAEEVRVETRERKVRGHRVNYEWRGSERERR